MKDSGIEWIGDIPEEWEVKRIQWGLTEVIKKNDPIKAENILSLTKDKGVIPYEDKGNLGNKSKANLADYKLAYRNSIVMNSMNVIIGSVGLSDYFGCVSPVYYVFKAEKNNDIRFFNYIFQMPVFQSILKKYANGILEIRLRVSSNDVLKRNIPFPNYKEQIKISNYLDKKTKQIEDVKNTINKEIENLENLENYKKSVITETVTKGLDKNVEMKDSGVEWIGEIPKHWKVIRIKNAAILKARIGWQGLKSDEFLDDSNLPYLVTGTDFKDGLVDWDNCVRISEKRFEMDKNIQIKENDLLITKDGTIGKLAIAKNCPDKASLNSGVFVMRNQGPYKYVDKYMYYLLQSEQFYLWFELNDAGNSTIRHLYQRDFYNFSFTYPEIKEQNQIVDYLDKKTKLIGDSIAIKQKQLETLEEYKKSLIYEYVTGKKEVNDGEET